MQRIRKTRPQPRRQDHGGFDCEHAIVLPLTNLPGYGRCQDCAGTVRIR